VIRIGQKNELTPSWRISPNPPEDLISITNQQLEPMNLKNQPFLQFYELKLGHVNLKSCWEVQCYPNAQSQMNLPPNGLAFALCYHRILFTHIPGNHDASEAYPLVDAER
jgi:hypothetical protein